MLGVRGEGVPVAVPPRRPPGRPGGSARSSSTPRHISSQVGASWPRSSRPARRTPAGAPARRRPPRTPAISGASTRLSNSGSVAGPAGGQTAGSSARAAASAPVSPAGGSIQPSSAGRCRSSTALCPVAQCRRERLGQRQQRRRAGLLGPLGEEGQPAPEQRHRRVHRVVAVGAGGTGWTGRAAAGRSTPAGFGTSSCGRVDVPVPRRPGPGPPATASVTPGEAVQVGQHDRGQLGGEREPLVAVAGLRHHQQPRRRPGAVPTSAASGAFASPAMASGTSTSGRSRQVQVADGGDRLGHARRRRACARAERRAAYSCGARRGPRRAAGRRPAAARRPPPAPARRRARRRPAPAPRPPSSIPPSASADRPARARAVCPRASCRQKYASSQAARHSGAYRASARCVSAARSVAGVGGRVDGEVRPARRRAGRRPGPSGPAGGAAPAAACARRRRLATGWLAKSRGQTSTTSCDTDSGSWPGGGEQFAQRQHVDGGLDRRRRTTLRRVRLAVDHRERLDLHDVEPAAEPGGDQVRFQVHPAGRPRPGRAAGGRTAPAPSPPAVDAAAGPVVPVRQVVRRRAEVGPGRPLRHRYAQPLARPAAAAPRRRRP